jgi:polyisoprenoid-binding protein YceI
MAQNKSVAEDVLKSQSWKIDEVHTKIRFSARHMIISEVEGEFKKFDFKMQHEGDEISNAQIEVTIEVNSLNTGSNDRDAHLRSADFFEVEKYPQMKFKSTSFEKVNDEQYKLRGDLTIKNITKRVELDVRYGGQIKDPWGNIRAGFNVRGTVNRFDYGLKWNNLMESGGAIVGKNINIIADIEVIKEVHEE